MALDPETAADDDSDDEPKKAKGKKDAEAEAEFISDAKKRFEVGRDAWDQNRRDALEDVKFSRLEEQWPPAIKRARELDQRPCLTINLMRTLILQVVNDARQNKPGIDVHPVGAGADPEIADIFNGLIRHIEQSSDGDVAYDTAMDGSVSGGFGFFRINTRYCNDDNFDQDLCEEPIADPFSVYPDPHDTGADSANWNQCHIVHEISKDKFEARWAKAEAVSFDTDRPEGARGEVTDEEKVVYCEEWLREPDLKTIVSLSAIGADQMGAMPAASDQASQLMGQQLIVGMDVYTEHKDLFDALGVKIQTKRQVTSHKVTQRFLSGSEILEEVEWAGVYIPIVPVWGEMLTVEGKRILRSLIRGGKDAQRMFNYWRTTATELVALAPKAPFIGRVGTFDTDAAKWATANTETHAYLEFDGNDAPERNPFVGVPTGALQQGEVSQQDLMATVGIYKSSLGAESNEDSGVAINARDKQADTGTFHFVDNLSRAIRHAGRILLDLIPKVYSTPRMLRILLPDGSPSMVPVNQPVPQMGPNGQPVMTQGPNGELVALTKTLDLTVGKYDLVVKAGPSYSTQREQMIAMLTELIRAEPSLAVALAPIFVSNYDIPDADKVLEAITNMGSQNPQLKQAQQIIQKGTQTIQALQQENAKLKGDKSWDAGDLAIKAFSAETDRLEAVAPNGFALDPNVIHALVLNSIQRIMQNPESLFSGDLAADPAFAAMVLPPAPGGPGAPPQAAPASAGPAPAMMPVQPPVGQAA